MKRGVWQQDLEVLMRSCLLDNMDMTRSEGFRQCVYVSVDVSPTEVIVFGWELEDYQRPGKETPQKPT